MSLQSRLEALVAAIGADIKQLGAQAVAIGGLSQDWSSTNPSSPTSGISLYSRDRARRLLASIGPSGTGQEIAYQPSLFSNRVSRVSAVSRSGIPTYDGIAVGTYAAAAAIAIHNSSTFFGGLVRARYSSIATAGSIGGLRTTTSQWFLSNTPNLGGFFFVCRFGLAVTATGNRVFVGLRSAVGTQNSNVETAIPDNVEPSTLTNMIGFGCDSTDGNLQLMTNDATGTATKIDLGSNFSSQSAATYFYEVRLFAPSGSSSAVRYSITRLNDGVVVQGTVTADLPGLGVMMAAHVVHSNGPTAAVVSLDLQSLYVESDN